MEIDTNANILDLGDIIKRLEELRGDLADSLTDGTEMDEEDAEELKILEVVNDEGEGYGDWGYGVTLINESYFTQYAQELADDICESTSRWPHCHIDWEAAAKALKDDYTTVEIDGTTFYYRM
jgi:hypothetical protein